MIINKWYFTWYLFEIYIKRYNKFHSPAVKCVQKIVLLNFNIVKFILLWKKKKYFNANIVANSFTKSRYMVSSLVRAWFIILIDFSIYLLPSLICSHEKWKYVVLSNQSKSIVIFPTNYNTSVDSKTLQLEEYLQPGLVAGNSCNFWVSCNIRVL